MEKEEIIQKFISFYTSSRIEQRGRRLYKSGAIKSIEYDRKTDTYHAQVQGSKLYKTRVSGVLKGDITTSCTCPFDWGSICKHTVAVLLYIQNNRREVSTLKNNNRELDEPIKITNFKNITESLILEKSNINNFEEINENYTLENVKFTKNTVAFFLKENSYYFRSSNYKVTFSLKNELLEINTTENAIVPKGKLRESEIFCLLTIAQSKMPDLFDILSDSKRLKRIKKSVSDKYGLTVNEFDKYFKLSFVEHEGLLILKKEKAYGLLQVNGEEDTSITDFIKDLSNDADNMSLIKLPKKELVTAFSLFYEEGYQDRGVLYNYMPIVAKPNKAKTRLSSRFSLLGESNINKAEITQEQKEIIALINDYETTHDKQQFDISKKIFHKLGEQSFVFIHNGSYFEHKLSPRDFEPIKLPLYYANIIIDVYNDGKFIVARLKIKINNEIIDKKEIDAEMFDAKIISYKGVLYHIASYKEYLLYKDFIDDVRIIKKQKTEFFNKIIKPLSENFQINFGKDTFNNSKVELDFKTSQIYISEKDDYIIFQPQVVYDNNVTVLLSSNANALYKNEETDEIVEYIRNFELEADFVNLIASMHPDFEEQKINKFFYLPFNDFTKNLWFYEFFDKLNARNIEIYGLKDLKNFKYSPYKGKVSTSIKSGQDWFDVEVNMNFGDYSVSLADIKKAVINKQKYIQLKDGSVGIMPEEWLNKLEKYFRNGTVKKDKLEISKLRYSIIDELFDNIDDAEIIEELAEKRKRLSAFKEINKTKIPKQIKAELRHYQKEGVNWVNFLDEMKWGGILADDMGLGKTLQILTFIQQKIAKDKTPNLIIVPTTLLFNWRAEIEKFAPKIKAYFHYGVDRNKSTEAFDKYHIIFTSYGVLLRDIEYLREFQFNYVVLDESQAIKNPASRRFKAVNLIKAKNRITLTGTPIENNTFDLYSQMSFVNPGIFGSINNFKQNYSNAIDKDGNEVVANELQKIINPFVLRRTKEMVAQELPTKTEDIIYCEMEPEQRKIYDAYRNEYRNKLLKNVEEQGVGKSKMMVLEALTRLRQICDSPSLIDKVDYNSQSIKIKEIINNIVHRTANHKILVFSQFVSMLSLIKTELDKHNIKYEYLDGKSTSTQREMAVNNFQTEDSLRVFLISLRAGGTGLNLTAADYVYIVDPWWNPAVENQAIDRCYRIGQDKKVFAYRMICKNTIEEKILDLQAKKKKIASDIIQTDDKLMKKLTIDDIKSLFG